MVVTGFISRWKQRKSKLLPTKRLGLDNGVWGGVGALAQAAEPIVRNWNEKEKDSIQEPVGTEHQEQGK